jgi:hypothetical protein
LIDVTLYKQIAPESLLWYGDAKKSASIMNFVKQSEIMGSFVIKLILEQSDIDQRIEYLMASIDLAEALYNLKNYHSAAAIITALQSPSINRLSKTWDQISEESEAIFQNLKDTFTKKYFKFIRDQVHTANAPCILYLRPLISEWQKNTKDLKSTMQVNATKYRIMSNFFLIILKTLQHDNFAFKPIPLVQEFFQGQTQISEKEMMIKSQSLEK